MGKKASRKKVQSSQNSKKPKKVTVNPIVFLDD